MRWIKPLLFALALAAFGNDAPASEYSCPLAEQRPMLTVQMFFGETFGDRGIVSDQAWQEFLRKEVTPRFPDGFTVYDAYGQSINPETHSISGEKTKVLVIATEDTDKTRTAISDLSKSYAKQFNQHSVGVLTNQSCGIF